ncbi:MAG: aminodeoxychorismate synthase component I [Desulfuromonas sp.]|nr:MAG: aminodeoxychorismate synthase component I [Desulfuromonas sp.]
MPITTLSFPLASFDPLACHLALCPDGPGFLESLNPGPKTGRYSILPLRWCERYRLTSDGLERFVGDKAYRLDGAPLDVLAGILAERSIEPHPKTPFPGGFFGYFGYDLARQIEELPQQARRDLPIPILNLYWIDVSAVYDHAGKTLTLASLDPQVDLEWFADRIRKCSHEPPAADLHLLEPPKALLSEEEFVAIVKRGKEYIAAGDIYQVNLSCRFDARINGSASELYRRLRTINPSPFACLLKFPEVEIISSSPERLVSLRAGQADTRPIAGTRPRGYNPSEDQLLGRELLCHPKERAEHIMLLDLERNDLGKVCQSGTVTVDELMVLERYSHVTHIVSNVSGRLKQECGPFDLLRATFPGGTITGVPKKRCMEIIDELEPVGRGVYTGSAGYISACGTMDLNILIRSFQRVGTTLSYQAGAGIVADSEPEREWRECLHKGDALKTLLDSLAQGD